MIRPRNFIKDEALERAMQLFWKKGYNASSLEELMRVMKIRKSSFYSTFKSKRDLFLSALKKYNEIQINELINILKSKENSIESIAGLFNYFMDKISLDDKKGCFFGNIINELIVDNDKEAHVIVQTALESLSKHLEQVLLKGKKNKELSKTINPTQQCYFILSNLQGILILAKMGVNHVFLENIRNQVLDSLR